MHGTRTNRDDGCGAVTELLVGLLVLVVPVGVLVVSLPAWFQARSVAQVAADEAARAAAVIGVERISSPDAAARQAAAVARGAVLQALRNHGYDLESVCPRDTAGGFGCVSVRGAPVPGDALDVTVSLPVAVRWPWGARLVDIRASASVIADPCRAVNAGAGLLATQRCEDDR